MSFAKTDGFAIDQFMHDQSGLAHYIEFRPKISTDGVALFVKDIRFSLENGEFKVASFGFRPKTNIWYRSEIQAIHKFCILKEGFVPTHIKCCAGWIFFSELV
ncbi:hypothetical protein D3C87_1414400 [compost metagenome]